MAARHPYRRGDVVRIRFPFSDAAGSKERPAVVISSDAYHDEWDELLVVAVTSRPPRRPRPTDCLLQDWQAEGLTQPSWVRCHLATVHRLLILERLGSLTPRDRASVDQCLRVATDL